MEFMEGATLKHRISGKPLPLGGSAGLGNRDWPTRLEAAHAKDIVHRAHQAPPTFLSPTAATPRYLILVSAKLQTKAGTDADATLTQEAQQLSTPGAAMGTLAYMSPEQARGRETGCAHGYFFFLVWCLYEMGDGKTDVFGK